MSKDTVRTGKVRAKFGYENWFATFLEGLSLLQTLLPPRFLSLESQSHVRFGMEDILKEAVSMGQANEVDSLLKKGVNADIIDENGYSLLHIACTVNETKILRLLIAHGLELEAEDHHYNTPLHVAYVGKTKKL